MKNKHAKQMMVDVALKGRKVYWFSEPSEKFLAHSTEEVIENHREYLGDEEVDDIVEAGEFGEIKMSISDWFQIKCWDEDTGKMVPSIDAVYDVGYVQISTSYL